MLALRSKACSLYDPQFEESFLLIIRNPSHISYMSSLHYACSTWFILAASNEATIVSSKHILNEGQGKHLKDVLLGCSSIEYILKSELLDFMIIIDGDTIAIYFDALFLNLFFWEQRAYSYPNRNSLFAHYSKYIINHHLYNLQ